MAKYTDEQIKAALDAADVFLRNRVNAKPTPLNKYDKEALLDIANTCDGAVSLINCQETEIERLKSERDMSVKDLYAGTRCRICRHLPDNGNMTHCQHYASCGLAYIHFMWRGTDEILE